MNSRTGVPITQSRARKITSRMNVVPRSSPSITSMLKIAAPGSSGISRCRHSVSWPAFSLRASRSAPHSTNASLANSDGWIWKPGDLIQRSPPSTVWPTASTSIRPSTDTATIG